MIKKHSEKIKKMELILPPAPKPAGVYRPTLVIDQFLYVSGQGPVNKDGSYIKIWEGVEDNVVAFDIMNKNPKITPTELFDELDSVYSKL